MAAVCGIAVDPILPGRKAVALATIILRETKEWFLTQCR